MTKTRNGPERNWPVLKHGTERSGKKMTKTRNESALPKQRNGTIRTRKLTKTRNGPAFFEE